MATSLPYEEPGITDILILSSFLLALNIINSVLNRTLYCGLVGQVLVGIAWGTPGGKWLPSSLEDTIVQLGYLGLIMIVFEGGLSTSVSTMKANLLLSVCVAITGIVAPMALSFSLGPMVGASYIQCFAAGASLCSTSLGTTFTVLSTSGLVSTRLGSILSTAAMMDDVVGLVMVQIVSSLSSSGAEISAATVIRPVLVSVAFATVLPLGCRLVLRPAMVKVDILRAKHAEVKIFKVLGIAQSVFVIQTGMLIALVVGASYAGASVLLAAYLAGVVGAWWDDQSLKSKDTSVASLSPSVDTAQSNPAPAATRSNIQGSSDVTAPSATVSHSAGVQSRTSSTDVYHLYYAQAVERILKPFFFASIGFSIPISKMFSGSIVWRGIIYSILMLIGKIFCGLWLVRFSVSVSGIFRTVYSSMASQTRIVLSRFKLGRFIHQSEKIAKGSRPETSISPPQEPALRDIQTPISSPPVAQVKEKRPNKPLSLYPAGILSFAMVARGEIGFLISSVAESNGTFRGSSSSAASPTSSSEQEASEIFLIVTWAIMLCTILGPLCVGLLVRRVKKLEARNVAQIEGYRKDVLGVWGVSCADSQ